MQSVAQAKELTSQCTLSSTKLYTGANKPLPSPPIAQIVRSPIAPPRGLIDASDKPLRRSPSGDPQQQEDWPVLFPEKPTTPGTLNQMIQNDTMSPSKHRRANMNSARTPKHRLLRPATSDQSISRNPSSSKMNGSKLISPTNTVGRLGSANTDSGAVKSKDLNFIHPRQTKTSTLRARKSENENIARGGTSQHSKADHLVSSVEKAEGINGRSQGSVTIKPPRGRRIPTNTGSTGRRAGTLHSASSQSNLRAPRTSLNALNSLEVKSLASSAQAVPSNGNHEISIKPDRKSFKIFDEAPKARIKKEPAEVMTEKRLSMKSPDHGPTLKIYRSAEKVIMGEGHKTDNSQGTKKRNSADLRRLVATKELRKARSASTGTLLESVATNDLVDSELYRKEGKEVDGKNCTLPTNYYQPHSDGSTKNLSISDTSKLPEIDDPFFDAKAVATKANDDSNSAEKNQQYSDDFHPVTTPGVENFDVASEEPLDASISKQTVSMPEVNQSLSDHSISFPPRSSSQATVPDFTVSPTEIDRRFSDEFLIRQNKSIISPTKVGTRFSDEFVICQNKHTVSPPGLETLFSDEFTLRQNNLGKTHGLNTVEYISDCHKRASTGRSSSQSQVSASKGGVLSNFRGLFHHKRGLNNAANRPMTKGKAKMKITTDGSPFPPISEIHPYHRPTPNSSVSSRRHSTRGTPNFSLPEHMTIPPSPSYQSPGLSGIAIATDMAIHICDSARSQSTIPKTECYLQMSAMMIKAVNQARDAQKALEEAKQAARKAEVASLLCEKAVADMVKNAQEYKNFVDSRL